MSLTDQADVDGTSSARCDCPNLLLSYEKALTFPRDFIDAIMRFCDIPRDRRTADRLLGVIEPNRPRYLAIARRRFDGLIEGVQRRAALWLVLPDAVGRTRHARCAGR